MAAWRARRQHAFLAQLPNALELMANALRAGFGLSSAFDLVAQELAEPLGGEFAKMVAEIKLGSSLEQAMDHLIERNPSGEIRLLAQAIAIHKQVGGNLAEVLDNLDRTIRERFTLQREIRSLTSEQRLTAWIMGLLPLGVGLGLAALNPAYILTLFHTTPGRCLLGVVVVLQMVGYVALRRILRVAF
jgi:tight adherence protein B